MIYTASDVTHEVSVIDEATNTITALVSASPTFIEPVALTPDLSTLVTGGGHSPAAGSWVYQIDTATNLIASTVDISTAIGGNYVPTGIVCDNTYAYIACEISGISYLLVKFELATSSVVGVIGPVTGSSPTAMTILPDFATIYASDAGIPGVQVIDTASWSITTTITAGLTAEPSGISATPDGTKVIVGESNITAGIANLHTIDPTTNTIVASAMVGAGSIVQILGLQATDTNVFFGAGTSPTPGPAIYSVHQWAISPFASVNNVPTGAASALCITQDYRFVYNINTIASGIIAAETVTCIDLSTFTIIATIPVGNFVFDICTGPLSPLTPAWVVGHVLTGAGGGSWHVGELP